MADQPRLSTVAREPVLRGSPGIASARQGDDRARQRHRQRTQDVASRRPCARGRHHRRRRHGPADGSQRGGRSLAVYIDAFPEPITLASMLERGSQQRFDIYCSVCHDRVGNGNGMIVQRGFPKPPSFRTDFSRGFQAQGERRQAQRGPRRLPVLEVVSNGFGAMPDYDDQISAKDRWAIVAYVRALQLSRDAHAGRCRRRHPSGSDCSRCGRCPDERIAFLGVAGGRALATALPDRCGRLLPRLALIGALFDPHQFFQSYLLGYFGWFCIALGSLAIQMIHHLTGGNWGLRDTAHP